MELVSPLYLYAALSAGARGRTGKAEAAAPGDGGPAARLAAVGDGRLRLVLRPDYIRGCLRARLADRRNMADHDYLRLSACPAVSHQRPGREWTGECAGTNPDARASAVPDHSRRRRAAAAGACAEAA
ncbi:hypothetical protein D3C71_1334210 [compost metagenome]